MQRAFKEACGAMVAMIVLLICLGLGIGYIALLVTAVTFASQAFGVLGSIGAFVLAMVLTVGLMVFIVELLRS